MTKEKGKQPVEEAVEEEQVPPPQQIAVDLHGPEAVQLRRLVEGDQSSNQPDSKIEMALQIRMGVGDAPAGVLFAPLPQMSELLLFQCLSQHPLLQNQPERQQLLKFLRVEGEVVLMLVATDLRVRLDLPGVAEAEAEEVTVAQEESICPAQTEAAVEDTGAEEAGAEETGEAEVAGEEAIIAGSESQL